MEQCCCSRCITLAHLALLFMLPFCDMVTLQAGCASVVGTFRRQHAITVMHSLAASFIHMILLSTIKKPCLCGWFEPGVLVSSYCPLLHRMQNRACAMACWPVALYCQCSCSRLLLWLLVGCCQKPVLCWPICALCVSQIAANGSGSHRLSATCCPTNRGLLLVVC